MNRLNQLYGRIVKPGNFKPSGEKPEIPTLDEAREVFSAPEEFVTPVEHPPEPEAEEEVGEGAPVANLDEETEKAPEATEDELLAKWEAEEQEVVDPLKLPKK